MEDGQGIILVLVDANLGLDVVAAMLVGRDLELFPLERHAIVPSDLPVVLLAEDLARVAADPRYKLIFDNLLSRH